MNPSIASGACHYLEYYKIEIIFFENSLLTSINEKTTESFRPQRHTSFHNVLFHNTVCETFLSNFTQQVWQKMTFSFRQKLQINGCAQFSSVGFMSLSFEGNSRPSLKLCSAPVRPTQTNWETHPVCGFCATSFGNMAASFLDCDFWCFSRFPPEIFRHEIDYIANQYMMPRYGPETLQSHIVSQHFTEHSTDPNENQYWCQTSRCTELVTVNSETFELLDNSGFLKIIQEIFQLLA